MKNTFWIMIANYLSLIFNILGILIAIYIGIFYVPNWLKDVQNEKGKNAYINLVQSIKELIYADSTISLTEINALVDAKMIDLNEESILSTKELLLSAQESFMQDKYLPLATRRTLLNEIEILKSQISPQNEIIKDSEKRKIGFLAWLSILFTCILGIIGFTSLYLKYKNDKTKQEEVDAQIAQLDSSTGAQSYYRTYEQEVFNIIKNYSGVEIVEEQIGKVSGYDMVFLYKNEEYYVEIKYLTKSKVGLGSLQRFLESVKGKEGNFWFIYNTEITELFKKKVKTLNSISSKRRIDLIKIETPFDLESKLKTLLN